MSNVDVKNFFYASAKDFEKIPGVPIAYWISDAVFKSYNFPPLSTYGRPCKGIDTGDNSIFLRMWFEIENEKMSYPQIEPLLEEDIKLYKWFPYNKGGDFRRWYGNNEYLLNWENNGTRLKTFNKSNLRNKDCYLKQGITWSTVTSAQSSMRLFNYGFFFDNGGSCLYASEHIIYILGFLDSNITKKFLSLSPTLNTQPGDIGRLPFAFARHNEEIINSLVKNCVSISKTDWDSFETSWDFQCCPLAVTPKEREEQFTYSFNADARRKSVTLISERYRFYRQKWARDTATMHRLEEENNRIFIEAYGLQDELTPDVPWNEITLTCNPWYRYGVGSGQRGVDCEAVADDDEQMPMNDELEARLKTDTIKEFISYAVGCMFGRYSLDKPGLILVNQGESVADYLKQIPQPTFMPDEDNVIPVLGEDWFDDDIVSRFNEFLKATFGEEHFIENLAFIEEALGKDVRSYFTKDFYKEHLQRYHNRPIYWLFSSPKGAFSTLIYMHRYRPETVGLVLTYLRSHITKVTQRIHALEITIDSADATAGMKSKAMRERAKLLKELQELEDYERDVLYPLSTEKIAIDLDDGVKVNYRKFGDALYKIKGLEAKEE